MDYTSEDVVRAASQAGFTGDNLRTSVAISLWENQTHELNATNPSGATGPWQIMSSVWSKVVPVQWFNDLYGSARSAMVVFLQAGQSFKPWTSYTGGQYQVFLPEADRAISAVTGSGGLPPIFPIQGYNSGGQPDPNTYLLGTQSFPIQQTVTSPGAFSNTLASIVQQVSYKPTISATPYNSVHLDDPVAPNPVPYNPAPVVNPYTYAPFPQYSAPVISDWNSVNNAPVVYSPQISFDAPSLPSAPSYQPTYYAVQAGDNLSAIASQFGTNWEDVAQRNNLADPNMLQIGQVLQIS